MMSYLGYARHGVCDLLGQWIQWLMTKFRNLIHDKKGLLPARAKAADSPLFYWIAAPLHENFSHDINEIRKKFNLCLHTTAKTLSNVQVIQLKEIWQYNLVVNNRITDLGLHAYWESVDSTFKFNHQKREIFLVKQKLSQSSATTATLHPLQMTGFCSYTIQKEPVYAWCAQKHA